MGLRQEKKRRSDPSLHRVRRLPSALLLGDPAPVPPCVPWRWGVDSPTFTCSSLFHRSLNVIPPPWLSPAPFLATPSTAFGFARPCRKPWLPFCFGGLRSSTIWALLPARCLIPPHLGRTISALWEPYFDEASIRSLSTRILTRLARILRQRPRTLVLVWYMTAGVPVLRAVSTTLCQAFAPSIAKACR